MSGEKKSPKDLVLKFDILNTKNKTHANTEVLYLILMTLSSLVQDFEPPFFILYIYIYIYTHTHIHMHI